MTILKYDSSLHEKVMQVLGPVGVQVSKIEINTFCDSIPTGIIEELAAIGVKYLTPS